MKYFLLDDHGRTVEARLDVRDGSIVLHSRSGASKTAPARNPGYSPALDAILSRLAPDGIERVLLDSKRAQQRPEKERVLAARTDFDTLSLEDVASKIRSAMRRFGRTPEMPANEGNSNKRLRFETPLSEKVLVQRLKLAPPTHAFAAPAGDPVTPGAGGSAAVVKRLSAVELRKVTAANVEHAVAKLIAGDDVPNFDPSRDYDALTTGGHAFAPKKVFALALEEALGIEPIPGHFSAGWGTPCFEILEQAGLWIVPKAGGAARPKPSPTAVQQAIISLSPTDEERRWIEGNPKIASHLKKERKPGLAGSKRAHFVKQHGKLLCEECGMDPVHIYGEEAGAACIEVHHNRTHVADMLPGHETVLEDLQCLCANCHRVLHRRLALGLDS